jgi:hypothetical protein
MTPTPEELAVETALRTAAVAQEVERQAQQTAERRSFTLSRRAVIAMFVINALALSAILFALYLSSAQRIRIEQSVEAHGCRTRQEFRISQLSLIAVTRAFGGKVPPEVVRALPKPERCPKQEMFPPLTVEPPKEGGGGAPHS